MSIVTDPIWSSLTDQATTHLQNLLRFNTINPPGNEGPAIMYVQRLLAAEENIETHILEPSPGRLNLWARLRGTGTKRPIVLLSHVDVVPVERQHWSVDPFGGEIIDGYIYGRGAVDMKGMTAKQITLFLHLARQQKAGLQLQRDIILLTVADEEQHGTHGMAWIAEHRADLLKDVEFAINEGGGFTVDFSGHRLYVCETAQKGIAQVTLRATGAPGHASVPHNDNSVARLGRALYRLSASPLPLHVTPTMRQFVTFLASLQPEPRRTIFQQILHPFLSEGVMRVLPDQNVAHSLRAMLHNTISPTILKAGSAINVIPAEATAQLDGRVIPGQTAEIFSTEIRQRISDPKVHVEVDLRSTGHESSANTDLFNAIQSSIATHDPGASVVPYLLPAVTDSRFLVPLGITAYGFDPMQPESGWPQPQQLAHSHDERISIANLNFGLRVLHDALLFLNK